MTLAAVKEAGTLIDIPWFLNSFTRILLFG